MYQLDTIKMCQKCLSMRFNHNIGQTKIKVPYILAYNQKNLDIYGPEVGRSTYTWVTKIFKMFPVDELCTL